MKQLLKELRWFFEQKIYLISLVLTAVCGYGFSIVQPIIGIDDTATGLYFDEGLAVVMGRWTIFLLNKIFPMADYAPFMMEVVGVILFGIAVTMFCVLLKRILGERIGIVGYTIFSCIFISNPIISEVNIYYIHNGADLAYLLTAVSLILFMDAMDCKGKKCIGKYLLSLLFVWLASGCYESMMIVYIIGLLIILFLRGAIGKDKVTFGYIGKHLGIGAILLAIAVVLRAIILEVIINVFRLHNMIGVQDLRTITELLQLFEPGNGMDTFIMLLKRYWVVYFVNAFVYLPITGYVLAVVVVGLAAIVCMLRRHNGWFLILFAGMLIAPFLLTIMEVSVTKYRTCQYLPFFTAFGMLLLYWQATGFKKAKWVSGACILFSAIMIYNQASGLNNGFYVDYKKYENTKDVLLEIAWEIEKEYGSNIPVVFTGHYETPYSIISDYCVPYSSWQYKCIAAITDLVDVHLKEKYFDPHGYSFIGEANYPFIQWGFNAFDGTNTQIMNFLRLHGHSFIVVTDEAVLEEAKTIGDTMPNWPAEGSVSMQGGYVLVHM